MELNIKFMNIRADQIVYDPFTQLFPFSPRREIDPLLKDRLKSSISATGFWNPIIVRESTFEGIAGNHRFLALVELSAEQGTPVEELFIPVAAVDCDEGLAVIIALAENDTREDLTQSELIPGLIAATQKKPHDVELAFGVDDATVQQLRLWTKELDYAAEVEGQRRKLQSRLTREWITLIKRRLAEYPELQAEFLSQLQHPTWVQARSLEELDREITQKLVDHGIQFTTGRTWNTTPTSKCLGCVTTFEQFQSDLRQGSSAHMPQSDGVVKGFCPHLRLFPQYTTQFIPEAGGDAIMEVDTTARQYPPEAVDVAKNSLSGRTIQLLATVEAYCVDPLLHKQDSCFHQQEGDTAQVAVEALRQQGLSGELPSFIRDRQYKGEFIWLEPVLEGQSCTGQTCRHANDNPPGFVLIPQPDGTSCLGCIHAECGGQARQAWEQNPSALQRQVTRIQTEATYQAIVERTVLAPEDERLELVNPNILEILEDVLMPYWDNETMVHIISGWQVVTRQGVALQLGPNTPTDRQVTAAWKRQFGVLTQKPIRDNTKHLFQRLRQNVVADAGLRTWITCLTLARFFRGPTGVQAPSMERLRTLLDL